MKYELHNNLDVDFPVIFGFKSLSAAGPDEVYLHWHDCIELIYCETGEGWVISGTNRIPIQKGDTVIINSGNIHDVFTESECGVYYLDLENALYAPFGLKPHLYLFREKTQDIRIEKSMRRIIEEMESKGIYYKQAVHMEIISVVIHMMREHLIHESREGLDDKQQAAAVKQTLSYLREHFLEHITIDELCNKIGYSKFYLCHSFKKSTGITIIQYVNFLRCQHARSLLLDGSHKVYESAAMSGFKNDSYFTRTYKAVFGKCPSDELPENDI